MGSQLLLLSLTCLTVMTSVAAVNSTDALPGCPSKCGDVNIPYPFGVGANCSIAPWANINCNTTLNQPKPFIGGLEVIRFSLDEVRIKNYIARSCYDQSGGLIWRVNFWISLVGTPYTFSSTKNKVTAIGCDTFGLVRGNAGYNYSSGCTSVCDRRQDVTEGICSGSGCCQTSIPRGVKEIIGAVGTLYNYTKIWSFDSCGAAFLAEEDAYTFQFTDYEKNITSLKEIPIVLNFGVGNQTCDVARRNSTTFACKDNSYCYDSQDGEGYLCACTDGYTGNPYLNRGCQDVNE